ncbi:MAG: type II secretion system GspH family protein [Acidobacteriota bacterium]|nr:type II secretion system GspH family protein [Acidobacteriota bacterium]
MDLQGQANRRSTAVSGAETGFALAAMLVAIAVLAVVMLVALPTWRQQAQREKEMELVFRGEQYARAIGLYQRKLAGAFPPSLDTLVQQKFLRKRYKDPISGEDFQPVFANSAQAVDAMRTQAQQGDAVMQAAVARAEGQVRATFQRPGAQTAAGQAPPGSGQATPGGAQPGPGLQRPGSPGQMPGQGQGSPGPVSGIVGVVSKSKAQSIRLYNGRNQYDQWIFVYSAVAGQAGQAGTPAPPAGPAQITAPGRSGRGGQ